MLASEKAACARTYPLGEPKSKNKICSERKKKKKKKGVYYESVLRVVVLNVPARWMLTYLVASFVGFLHQHPPLVVQLHGHVAAAVREFAHPVEELLQLPAQGGLGVAGARHQSL